MSVELKAPLPGTVMQLFVNVGDAVQRDDQLLVLEAMKMEQPFFSPVAGSVKEIRVKANDSVETGSVMIVIE